VPQFGNDKPAPDLSGMKTTSGATGGISPGEKTNAPQPPVPPMKETAEPGVQLQQPVRPNSERTVPAVAASSGSPAAPPRPAVSEAVPAVVKAPRAPADSAQVASAKATEVISYDEVTHQCAASDNFRTISQKYYGNDQYEQALLRFNQNHPLATEAVKQNPPALKPGQAVYIPPADILRKYYGAAPAEAAPPTPSASLEGVGVSAIRPVAVAPPAAPSAPVYHVRGKDEMIYEIAQRTLGKGDRWPEIFQLNKDLDTTRPIPVGTELRLPADGHGE
jgi:hypothetical protein